MSLLTTSPRVVQLLLALLVEGALLSTSPAAQMVWTNNAGGVLTGRSTYWTNISDSGSVTSRWWASGWTPGYPNGVDVTALFIGTGNGATSSNYVDVAITNGAIRFVTGGSQNFNLFSNGANGRLYMQVSAGSAIIDNVISGSGALDTIATPITLLSALTVSNTAPSRANGLQLLGSIDNNGFNLLFAGDGNTLVAGQVSGSGTLTVGGSNGVGSVSLTNVNLYTGGTIVTSGVLNLNHALAIGTGSLTLQTGATLDNTSAAALTLATTNSQLWNANFAFTGTKNLNMGWGGVTLGTNVMVTVSANQLAVTNLTDGGSGYGITKVGNGTLVLWGGSNSYRGPTTIFAGAITNVAPYGLPFGSGSLVLTNTGLAALRPASGSGAITLYGGTNPGSVFSYAGGNTLVFGTGATTGLTYIFGSGDSNAQVLTRIGRGTLQILDDGNGSVPTFGNSVKLMFAGQTPTNINGMVSPSVVRNTPLNAYIPEFLTNDPVKGLVSVTYNASTLATSDNTKRLNLDNAAGAIGTNILGDGASASAYAARIGGGSTAAILIMSNNAVFNLGNAAQSGEAGLILSGGTASGFYQAAGTANATLNFSAAEGIIWSGSRGGVIGVGISGNNGTTFNALGGSIILMGATSTVSGPLSVNQGTLVLSNGAAYLGASTVSVLGSLTVRSNSVLAASSDFTLGPNASLAAIGAGVTISAAGRFQSFVTNGGGLTLSGGNLTVGSLIATNNGGANQVLLSGGTLTASNGLQLAFYGDPNIGGAAGSFLTINVLGGPTNFLSTVTGGLHPAQTAGATTIFNFLGGTTYLAAAINSFALGEGVGSTGLMTLAGPNAVLVGQGRWTLGGTALGFGSVTVSNGGTLSLPIATSSPSGIGGIGGRGLLVVDNGTFSSPNQNLYFGNGTTNSLLMVTNGGRLNTAGLVFALGASGIPGGNNASSNLIVVTDSGSVLTNFGGTAFGANASSTNTTYNRLLVLDGGRFIHTGVSGLTIGGGTNAYGNAVAVSGSGSLLSAPSVGLGTALLGATNNTLWVTNGGTLALGSGGLFIGPGGGAVYLDRATLRANANSSFFISNAVPVFLGSGGLTVDDSGSNVTVVAVLAEDPSSTGGGLTKIGPGTLVLASNNTWTGGTVISNGTLQVGASGASGSILGGILNNGLLAFNRSDAYTVGGAITGSGALLKSGAGVLTLTNANSYSGGTTNSAGVLAVGHNDALGVGTLVLAGGALRSADGGARTLTNALVISANTVFGASGTGDLLLTGGLNLGGGRTLTVSNGITTFGGSVTNGALTKGGDGVLVLGNAGLTNFGYGSGNAGTIKVTGGQLLAPTLSLGAGASDTASLVIQGSGASVLVTNGSSLNSRMGGTGSQLLVLDGGQLVINHPSGDGGFAYNAGTGGLFLVSGTNSLVSVTLNNFSMGNSGQGRLVVSNSGTVAVNTLFQLGSSTGAPGTNSILVSDAGSLFIVSNSTLRVGERTSYNSMTVSNAGRAFTSTGVIGNQGAGISWSNMVVVTDPGSSWSTPTALTVGNNGSYNVLYVTNGGAVYAGTTTVGGGPATTNNRAVVSTGGVWTNNSLTLQGQGTRIDVVSGGILNSASAVMGAGSAGAADNSNNVVLVAGPGSVWSNATTLTVGWRESYAHQVIVSNGGAVYMGGAVTVGSTQSNYNDRVFVGGSGSLFEVTNSVAITIGSGTIGYGNQVIVTNGATLRAGAMIVGGGEQSSNNLFLVSGAGTLAQVGAGLSVGTNNSNYAGSVTPKGLGFAFVNDGAVLEANALAAGKSNSGTISNLNATYQFATGTPTIIPNTAGAITITDGTISFRGVTNADVSGSLGGNQLASIVFAGNNTFRLNSASNWSANSQNYTFNTGLGPSNYVALELVNGATAWKSAWLALGGNGALLVSNTTANLYGVLTNAGTLTVANANASFWSNVVLNSGSLYRALAGTNTFNAGLTINAGATMTMDAWSVLTGGVTNNSLLQILTNAVWALTGGQLPAGSGALNVSYGGALTFSNGIFAGLGAGGITNDGLVDVQNLAVLNLGGSASTPWGSGVLRVSGGGALNFTTGSFTVVNAVSNLGTVFASNALVTFSAPVVIGGSYISDPSTNVFTTNVTVTASGALVGSNGDLFVFHKDLFMQSTNRSQFSLWQASVLFSNGPSHTLNVTGSGAEDLGTYTNFSYFSTNFAIGQLSIAFGDKLTLTGSKSGSLTNALYVGWLDIQGLGSGSLLTNDYLAVSNTLVTVLSLPDVNLYYNKFDPRNDWLTTFIPNLGYELWGRGNGLLLPIPEPSPLLALGAGLALLVFLRRRAA